MTLPTFWMAEQIFFSCISSNSLSFEDNSSEERCLASLSSVFLGEKSQNPIGFLLLPLIIL